MSNESKSTHIVEYKLSIIIMIKIQFNRKISTVVVYLDNPMYMYATLLTITKVTYLILFLICTENINTTYNIFYVILCVILE